MWWRWEKCCTSALICLAVTSKCLSEPDIVIDEISQSCSLLCQCRSLTLKRCALSSKCTSYAVRAFNMLLSLFTWIFSSASWLPATLRSCTTGYLGCHLYANHIWFLCTNHQGHSPPFEWITGGWMEGLWYASYLCMKSWLSICVNWNTKLIDVFRFVECIF